PTTAGRIRILEGESRALHRAYVINRDAVQVLRRERINENVEPLTRDDDVVLRSAILDDQAVLEATAAARLHAHAKPAFLGGDAFGIHKLLDLNASIGRDGGIDFRLRRNGHLSSSTT